MVVIRKYDKQGLETYLAGYFLAGQDEDRIDKMLIRMRNGIEYEETQRLLLDMLYQKTLSMLNFRRLIELYVWEPAKLLFDFYHKAIEEGQTIIAISLLKDAYEFDQTDRDIVFAFIELLKALGRDDSIASVKQKYYASVKTETEE